MHPMDLVSPSTAGSNYGRRIPLNHMSSRRGLLSDFLSQLSEFLWIFSVAEETMSFPELSIVDSGEGQCQVQQSRRTEVSPVSIYRHRFTLV